MTHAVREIVPLAAAAGNFGSAAGAAVANETFVADRRGFGDAVGLTFGGDAASRAGDLARVRVATGDVLRGMNDDGGRLLRSRDVQSLCASLSASHLALCSVRVCGVSCSQVKST
eukprot:6078374-Prymnesium_polylepis.1